jgi:hypothetical protein
VVLMMMLLLLVVVVVVTVVVVIAIVSVVVVVDGLLTVVGGSWGTTEQFEVGLAGGVDDGTVDIVDTDGYRISSVVVVVVAVVAGRMERWMVAAAVDTMDVVVESGQRIEVVGIHW